MQHLSKAYPHPVHENRQIWMRYIPHSQVALEVQDECTDKIAKTWLVSDVGLSYSMLGKYEEGERMLQQAVELYEEVLGLEDQSILNSMNDLANVLDEHGKHSEAEYMHRQTLELKEEVLGREHPSTLNNMNNLANVLVDQGKHSEAEHMHRQSLELTAKTLGRKHPTTLSIMNNLGCT
jgi:tetratricopeptide (TPR) repeat protein